MYSFHLILTTEKLSKVSTHVAEDTLLNTEYPVMEHITLLILESKKYFLFKVE